MRGQLTERWLGGKLWSRNKSVHSLGLSPLLLDLVEYDLIWVSLAYKMQRLYFTANSVIADPLFSLAIPV